MASPAGMTRLVVGTGNNLLTLPPSAPPAPKYRATSAPSTASCECPSGIQAMLRLFPDMPERVIVGRCSKCYGCYKHSRFKGYERFRKQLPLLMAAETARTGLSEAEYCWRHMRMLTVTVNSEHYMGTITAEQAASGIGVEGQRLVYSPMTFRLHLDKFLKLLGNLFRSADCDGKLEYWVQCEPQGPKAKWRLHIHVLLFAVPESWMVWQGPDAKSRKAPVGRAEWLDEVAYGESSSLARKLLSTGFWGVSDCRRVDSLDAAMDYVTKEMNTADVYGDVTPKLLDEIFVDEAIGRRVRSVRYSSAFNTPGPEGVEGFLVDVPLWKLTGFVPEVPPVQARLPIPPEMWESMRRTALKRDVGKLRECDAFEVALALQADLSAERAAARYRIRRDKRLWRCVTHKPGTVRGRWQTPESYVLEKAKRRRRRRARDLRDWAGVPPWLFVRRSFMRSELVARRC